MPDYFECLTAEGWGREIGSEKLICKEEFFKPELKAVFASWEMMVN